MFSWYNWKDLIFKCKICKRVCLMSKEDLKRFLKKTYDPWTKCNDVIPKDFWNRKSFKIYSWGWDLQWSNCDLPVMIITFNHKTSSIPFNIIFHRAVMSNSVFGSVGSDIGIFQLYIHRKECNSPPYISLG